MSIAPLLVTSFLIGLGMVVEPAIATENQPEPQCANCRHKIRAFLPDLHYFPHDPGNDDSTEDDGDLEKLAMTIWGLGSEPSASELAPRRSRSTEARIELAVARRGQEHETAEDPEPEEEEGWSTVEDRKCEIELDGCHENQYWTNCWSHDECGPEEELATAVAAVQAENAIALRELMRGAGAKVVVVNKKRSAIQLLGCTGQVIGHLPVDQAFLEAVSK